MPEFKILSFCLEHLEHCIISHKEYQKGAHGASCHTQLKFAFQHHLFPYIKDKGKRIKGSYFNWGSL